MLKRSLYSLSEKLMDEENNLALLKARALLRIKAEDIFRFSKEVSITEPEFVCVEPMRMSNIDDICGTF